MKFEVGQKVRDIGSEYTASGDVWNVGAIGEVTRVQEGMPYPINARFNAPDGTSRNFLFSEEELEAVNE